MSTRKQSLQIRLVLLLLAIVALSFGDLALDLTGGMTPAHYVIEIALIALCLATALYLGISLLRTQRVLARYQATDKSAQTFINGLGRAIDDQLCEWGLTAAERNTALLLLKGMSHKDIALATDRSERTIRQQAVAIYRKSGLAGRAELSAFFLEDLLLPSDANITTLTSRSPAPKDKDVREKPALV